MLGVKNSRFSCELRLRSQRCCKIFAVLVPRIIVWPHLFSRHGLVSGTSHFTPFGFILLLSLLMKLFAPSLNILLLILCKKMKFSYSCFDSSEEEFSYYFASSFHRRNKINFLEWFKVNPNLFIEVFLIAQ